LIGLRGVSTFLRREPDRAKRRGVEGFALERIREARQNWLRINNWCKLLERLDADPIELARMVRAGYGCAGTVFINNVDFGPLLRVILASWDKGTEDILRPISLLLPRGAPQTRVGFAVAARFSRTDEACAAYASSIGAGFWDLDEGLQRRIMTSPLLEAKAAAKVFADVPLEKERARMWIKRPEVIVHALAGQRQFEVRVAVEGSIPTTTGLSGLCGWQTPERPGDAVPTKRWVDPAPGPEPSADVAADLRGLWHCALGYLRDTDEAGARRCGGLMRVLILIQLRVSGTGFRDREERETLKTLLGKTSGSAAFVELERLWSHLSAEEVACLVREQSLLLDGAFNVDFALVESRLREFIFAVLFLNWGDELDGETLCGHEGFRRWVVGFGEVGTPQAVAAVDVFWDCAARKGWKWAVGLVLSWRKIFLREGVSAPAMILGLTEEAPSLDQPAGGEVVSRDSGVAGGPPERVGAWVDSRGVVRLTGDDLQDIALCLGRVPNPDRERFQQATKSLMARRWSAVAPEFEGVVKGLVTAVARGSDDGQVEFLLGLGGGGRGLRTRLQIEAEARAAPGCAVPLIVLRRELGLT
jgi:hypothetical protein